MYMYIIIYIYIYIYNYIYIYILYIFRQDGLQQKAIYIGLSISHMALYL